MEEMKQCVVTLLFTKTKKAFNFSVFNLYL